MKCDECCVDKREDGSVIRRDEDHVPCDRCRWLDIFCAACIHQRHYEKPIPGVWDAVNDEFGEEDGNGGL